MVYVTFVIINASVACVLLSSFKKFVNSKPYKDIVSVLFCDTQGMKEFLNTTVFILKLNTKEIIADRNKKRQGTELKLGYKYIQGTKLDTGDSNM